MRGRWLRSQRAATALVIVAAALLSGCEIPPGGISGSTAHPTTATAHVTTTTAPPTTTTTFPHLPRLVEGDRGQAVVTLQRRLTQLGYWLGRVDGIFGDATQQAVFAIQKAAHLAPDGAVGGATQAALRRGVVPTPRRANGDVIEIDLASDLLMFVRDGHLRVTLNTSTGGGYVYDVGGVSAIAATPEGWFSIYRQVDGLVVDALGALWRPKYFDSGFAIHGDDYVPPVPVSHGCVRVSNEAIDWIWAIDLAPLGTRVWVY